MVSLVPRRLLLPEITATSRSSRPRRSWARSLGLLGQIQRVGDPEGWPPQPGDERHADLGLAGPAGGHQHALTPFAGKGGVHGLLLVVPQGKAGLFKGAGLAPQGPVFGHGACRRCRQTSSAMPRGSVRALPLISYSMMVLGMFQAGRPSRRAFS